MISWGSSRKLCAIVCAGLQAPLSVAWGAGIEAELNKMGQITSCERAEFHLQGLRADRESKDDAIAALRAYAAKLERAVRDLTTQLELERVIKEKLLKEQGHPQEGR